MFTPSASLPVVIGFMVLSIMVGLMVLGSVAYLWLLLGAAIAASRRSAESGILPVPAVAPRAALVVPAHDEQMVLATTLASLTAQQYPEGALDIVVIADNCTDRTADIAREWGAVVLERTDLSERGKGYALAWAFRQLLGDASPLEKQNRVPVEYFLIVDADTYAPPDFALRMSAYLTAHPDVSAVQGRYGVLNANEGWRAALMTAAFDLFNHVKLLGADRLGWSVGLKGNGMAFRRALLQQAPWRGDSITEDIDYGLDLLQHQRTRVRYLPGAQVRAQMPLSGAQAASQRERWERGRYRLLRERAWPLFFAGLTQRRLALCAAAVDLVVPPLAELAALTVGWGVLLALAVALHTLPSATVPVFASLLVLAVCALVGYVLCGLRVAGAQPEAYRALLRAPFYIAWKFVLYAAKPLRKLTQRRASSPADTQEEWVRTERTIMTVTPETPAEVHPTPQHTESDRPADAARS